MKVKRLFFTNKIQVVGVNGRYEPAVGEIHVGMPCKENAGGGKIARIEVMPEIHSYAIYKVDDKGEPIRVFGIGGEAKAAADFVAIPFTACSSASIELEPQDREKRQK